MIITAQLAAERIESGRDIVEGTTTNGEYEPDYVVLTDTEAQQTDHCLLDDLLQIIPDLNFG